MWQSTPMPDERIRREVTLCAFRGFRGIIFKLLIIRHSEITLLHDNYIGAAVYVLLQATSERWMSFHARLTLMDIFHSKSRHWL